MEGRSELLTRNSAANLIQNIKKKLELNKVTCFQAL